MKLWLVVGVLLLSAPVSAEEKASLKMQSLSWAALVGGQAADVYTTFKDLPMGGGHCVEGNSGVFGSNPDLKRMVITKAVIVAPVAAITVWADRQGQHKVANVSRFVFGAFGGSMAAWNVKQIGVCR